tara:strand:+ start:1128 stop:1328 length:201 start_codon:yes stop_codon:yes gene_type:complete
MRVSLPKLKVFKKEDDLREYLDQSNIVGEEMEEYVKTWKGIMKKPASPRKKTTMVVTETDKTVETK